MPEIEEQEHDAGANAALPVKNILFGKYELGKLLGCGAFAKVYHARNLQSGQSVAIKAISKQKVLKSGLTSHIKREICIMRRLRHPNIVKLIEVLASKTKIFFVMEFVKGGELFSKVAKGRFSEDLSRRYFQQLISAVEYCHSHGVFHRDLKPENLLLDENGDLKVSDFGLSAVTDEQIRNDGLLHTLCGTPAYVAPEILAKQGYDGAKVDIWSCGVILFVMNAGYLPFNDPNLMVMYRKIYKGEFRCPKWMSPDLRRFLSRLLDTNPETRITVDEITRDPWFTKGIFNHYKPPVQYNNINNEEDCFGATFKPENKEDDNSAVTFLNAFDIISFSSGFDLSGLFNGSGSSAGEKRVVSAESPEKIVEKIEEVAKKENVGVQKKDVMMVALVGQKGETLVRIEIHRLTEILVVLEMCFFVEIWREKLDGLFRSLTYQPEASVPGN